MKYYQTSYKIPAAQKVGISSTAAVLSAAITTFKETVRLSANVDLWFTSGSSTVVASSTGDSVSVFLPGGTAEYTNPLGPYFSVIANGSSGFMSIGDCSQ